MSHRVFGRFTLLGRGACMALLWVALSIPSPAWVSIRNVDFQEANLPGHEEVYQEIAIHLQGERSSGGSEARGFHRDVSVRLELAYTVGTSRDDRLECYRSEVHLVGIAPRSDKTVYFYLPPEIVLRDRLNRPPAGWRVSILVGGKLLPNRPGSYSTNLADPVAAQSFLEHIQRFAPLNDGVLLPIYLTPFYADMHRRVEKSPAYKRQEAAVSHSGAEPQLSGAP